MFQIMSPPLPVSRILNHVFKMAETADELMNIYQTKSMVQSQTQKEKAAHVFTWFCLPVDKSPDFYRNLQIFLHQSPDFWCFGVERSVLPASFTCSMSQKDFFLPYMYLLPVT